MERYLRNSVEYLDAEGFETICGEWSIETDGGAVAQINFDGRRVHSARILINREFYQQTLGQDFMDIVPYDIEHEVRECLELAKIEQRGNKQELSASFDSHGPQHRTAIRAALSRAYSDGVLDRYMEYIRTEMGTNGEKDREWVADELNYYESVAKELRS